MKKTLAIAALLVMSVSALSFANGNSEAAAAGTYGQGYGRSADRNSATFERPFEQGEEITLTGTLKIKDGDRPVLVTTDGEVQLMYPYINGDDIALKDGQEITVKGYDTPAYRWSDNEGEKHFMVTEATIDGKEYKLDSGSFGPMAGRGGAKDGKRMASAQSGNGQGRMGSRQGGNSAGSMGGRW